MTEDRLSKICDMISQFASCMMGSGVHTDRVERVSRRLCASQGVELQLATFFHSLIITLQDKETGKNLTRVVHVSGNIPICFARTAAFSQLSWEAIDQKLSLEEIQTRFDAILKTPRLHPALVLLAASIANGCFAALFGADWIAILIVFFSTAIGFRLRQFLHGKLNAYIVVALSAFAASLCASSSLFFHCSSSIALATCPLFLIPGVPLINGFIDILEGHILIGISRLISASITVTSIAIGLAATLLILQGKLL